MLLSHPFPEFKMHKFIRLVAAATPALLLSLNACLPYTVGSTAQTVPAGETAKTTSWYFIPNGVAAPDDSIAAPLYGADYEYRRGLDATSDIGFRILPAGITMDYKRRIGSDFRATSTAFAFMTGGGIVNGGEHFLMQGTLIASGNPYATVTPYGGVRAMHVVPITQGAVRDKPTIGAFGGLQIGDAAFTIRPELGVYYDHSALGLRRGDLIFVPAFTLGRGKSRDIRQSRGGSPDWAAPAARRPVPAAGVIPRPLPIGLPSKG